MTNVSGFRVEYFLKTARGYPKDAGVTPWQRATLFFPWSAPQPLPSPIAGELGRSIGAILRRAGRCIPPSASFSSQSALGFVLRDSPKNVGPRSFLMAGFGLLCPSFV